MADLGVCNFQSLWRGCLHALCTINPMAAEFGWVSNWDDVVVTTERVVMGLIIAIQVDPTGSVAICLAAGCSSKFTHACVHYTHKLYDLWLLLCVNFNKSLQVYFRFGGCDCLCGNWWNYLFLFGSTC